MQIKVHTDNHITGDERLDEYTDGLIRGAVEHFQDYVTRVDAHLADENGAKGSDGDKRCTLEAHVAGQAPIAVTAHAGTVREAMSGAAAKLEKVLSGLHERRSHKHPAHGAAQPDIVDAAT